MNAITAVEKDGVTLNRYEDIRTEYSQPPRLRAGQCRAAELCLCALAVWRLGSSGFCEAVGGFGCHPAAREGRAALQAHFFPYSAHAFRYARNYLLQDSLTVRRSYSPA